MAEWCWWDLTKRHARCLERHHPIEGCSAHAIVDVPISVAMWCKLSVASWCDIRGLTGSVYHNGKSRELLQGVTVRQWEFNAILEFYIESCNSKFLRVILNQVTPMLQFLQT